MQLLFYFLILCEANLHEFLFRLVKKKVIFRSRCADKWSIFQHGVAYSNQFILDWKKMLANGKKNCKKERAHRWTPEGPSPNENLVVFNTIQLFLNIQMVTLFSADLFQIRSLIYLETKRKRFWYVNSLLRQQRTRSNLWILHSTDKYSQMHSNMQYRFYYDFIGKRSISQKNPKIKWHFSC